MSKSFTILCLSLVVIAGSPLALNAKTWQISNEQSPLIVSEPDKLDLWIEKLAFQESSGREDIQIIDSNGKWSRGCLQFQDETWRRFSATYRLEAPIMDCAAQKRLARQILLRVPRGWLHWKNSVVKIGPPPIDDSLLL